MIRVVIPKGSSGILAGHGSQDPSARSSRQATKAVRAEAVQVQAESVTLDEARQVHGWQGMGGTTRIPPPRLGAWWMGGGGIHVSKGDGGG